MLLPRTSSAGVADAMIKACDHRSGIAHADCRSLGLCARRHHAQQYAVESRQYLLQRDDSQGHYACAAETGMAKVIALGLTSPPSCYKEATIERGTDTR